ncbi:MAG: Gfo/Idh/MocA family oxidoreductase [Candidatus Acidiferrum sp.]
MKSGKVKWGILGVASIAKRKVIPAMQQGDYSEVTGIASRELAKAQEAAAKFGIAKAYGSYAEMLADPEIEAIYNPLPNELHVPWSIKAMDAGKHVLCEKPIGLNVAEAKQLLAARDRTGMKCGEAFMIRLHPQWLRAREVVRSGKIGELRAIMATFSYFDRAAHSIHNNPNGGGGLLDIGCYPINTSRFIFGEEPTKVVGLVERDPEMKIDRLTSAILAYPSGQAIFTCSTQLVYHQSMELFCTRGRIVMEIPYSAPLDLPTNIVIDEDLGRKGNASTTEVIPACNQYTLQGDAFSKAIREDGEVPVPLEDAIKNMAVIDAVFRSGASRQWEAPSF